ncbi:MAG TPA: N-acetylmuramoyl-L-alanine amidase [Caulobacteraceae bacterium]|nr:N-acetylmuramoyl-L-alanine amidase [Caulobacteraceae bacterium]
MPARLVGAIGSAWGRLAAAFGAVLCLATAASQNTTVGQDVRSVRLGGDSAMTRVVVELNQSAKGRLIVADGSPRTPVILALPGVALDTDLHGAGLGLVTHWSVDSAAGAARVRLALARPASVRRRFLLPPGDGAPTYRYVIDLEPIGAAGARPAAYAPRGAAHNPLATTRALLSHARKVVVIDPGHGGRDPGAHGAVSREKDVNLTAARALRAKLEATGRYRVVLTRSSDVYVPLPTRVEIARRANADLFISLHSDSGPTNGIRGATVYTLSDKGSERVVHGVTDRTNWLMSAELRGQSPAVNQILRDLTQRATRNCSDAFAESLLGHIADRAQAHSGHRDAGFMVLLAPDVPAVLLEMGYINNPEDERLLNNPAQRDRFMGEVAAAIDDYFRQGVQIAALR